MSIIACFFLALIPYAASFTFNFRKISQNNFKNIIISGDAASTFGNGIQVNNLSGWVAGRATYIRPLHLWENNSTYLASFSTSFTFVIDSNGSDVYADGLAFFLAQNNSEISKGGSFGLPFNSKTNEATYKFIAVEFDSFGNNEWDPKDNVTKKPIGEHVGININSITSVAYRKWYPNITHGKVCKALIKYHSDSKNLSVSFTSFKNNLPVWESGLHYTVDLRDVLPERVIFGFSASTGDHYEQTNVKSWSFKSTEFKGDENKGLAPTTQSISPPSAKSISPPPTESISPSPTKSISPSPAESIDPSSSPSPTKSIDQSSNLPPTKSIDQSSNLPPTKSIGQSSSPPPGKEALIAGILVLVFHYMAAL